MRIGEFTFVFARLDEDENSRDESSKMATKGYIHY